MTRRKNLVHRQPNGQPRRQPMMLPPTEVRRMIDAEIVEKRKPEWGSSLGRLVLARRITETQYSAGKRWAELVEQYSIACQAPQPPRSARLERGGGEDADPNSLQGVKEARRHAQTKKAYLEASAALRLMGKAAEAAVTDVCIKDLHTVGLIHLRGGLSALAALWGSRQ